MQLNQAALFFLISTGCNKQRKEAVNIYEKDELIYSRFLTDGNESDLRTLLERHREGLFLFLFGYVGNEEDAEELMMDAFAVVASGTSVFSGRSSFKTWLFGIARNQAKMFMRKKKGFLYSLDEIREKHQSEYPAKHEEHDMPETELLRQEQNKKLYMALETLPAGYRQVLYLIYFEEMSADEAALIMGKTRKQVYNLTQRGRMALKKTLERMEFDYEKY